MCYRCGKTNHDQKECRFKDVDCHNCGKRGHIAAACRSPKKSAKAHPPRRTKRYSKEHRPQTKYVTAEANSEPEDDEQLPLYTVGGGTTPPIKVPMEINDKPVYMELDTGAAMTIMSETQFKELLPGVELRESNVLLKTYSGERLPVKGESVVRVQHNGQSQELVLTIVAGQGPSLLGRDWLKHLRLDWKEVHALSKHEEGSLEYLLDKYAELFSEELGTIKTFCAELNVDPAAKPKFFKARTVPFALRTAIEDELDRLEREGIIEKVTHSEWATPIVAVPKPDGRVRLCGDFKVTVNQALAVDQYPLPKVDDLLATLAGGKRFTKLDLKQAYLQLELHSDSQEYCTVNTHRGLYRFKRLPFGIASAPALFQRVMDTILQGVPGTMCYIDDILVTGATTDVHLRNLDEVLRRLQKYGIRMKRSKCSFLKDAVEYLGHRVDAKGIQATQEKIAAIERAPMPQNVQQLRSFLGLLNYYRKFLPNLATIIQPLNDLLQKNRKWSWSAECTQAVNTAKQLLTTSNLLTHYNPTLPLRLAADASQYGLGAVISHVLPSGEEKPIAFASRALTKSERNYSQIDKEALALVYGVRKFHTYLYGRDFTLVTDHKPLVSILGPKKGVPAVAAARLQRWAILLSAYKYHIEFRSTDAHGNADALSRLPLPTTTPVQPSETRMYHIRQIESLPVTSQAVRNATQRDPILSKVKIYTQKGWPEQIPDTLKIYHSKMAELTVEEGCLLWGGRVIIPHSLKAKVMAELHKEHLGIAKMKAVARSYVWWRGIDRDLEQVAKSCSACAAVKQAPVKAPLHPWTWPSRPWERVHIDFAGPFLNKNFLIAVDAHSKWAEVVEMSQTTTAKTITALRHMFATHGIPEQLVSDNGPQFTSTEFVEFVKANGIKHTKSSPYHPATNGKAERFVRTFKEAMKTGRSGGLTLAHQLDNFLLTYRTTPHSTTGVPPCELLMGRSLHTRLDLLRPNLGRTVRQSQSREIEGSTRLRNFDIGAPVMARNFGGSGPDWVPGVIAQKIGPLTYLVDVSGGRLWKRHVDHIKDHQRSETVSDDSEIDVDIPDTPEPREPDVIDNPETETPEEPTEPTPPEEPSAPDPSTESRRYPTRQRRAPERFDSQTW